MLKYSTLGPLLVRDGGIPTTPSRSMPCQILALLLMRPNQIVSLDSIIYELWDDRPPPSATSTVQSYIHHIRKKVSVGGSVLASQEILLTRKPGYLLRVGPDDLDSARFTDLVPLGRHALEDGRLEVAENHLKDALELWHGAVLADVSPGPLLRVHIVHLEEGRRTAEDLQIEVNLRLGRHRDILGDLRSLVEGNPLDERLCAQLITALNLSGRRCEALREYTRMRQVLNEEFGLEPNLELRSIQHDILTV